METGDDIKKKRRFSQIMNTPESDVMKVELHPIGEEEDLGFFACMTIDRPDKLNALNADVMASLKAVSQGRLPMSAEEGSERRSSSGGGNGCTAEPTS